MRRELGDCQTAQAPKGASAEQRKCRTTQLPNNAGAKPRECQRARVPKGASAKRRSRQTARPVKMRGRGDADGDKTMTAMQPSRLTMVHAQSSRSRRARRRGPGRRRDQSTHRRGAAPTSLRGAASGFGPVDFREHQRGVWPRYDRRTQPLTSRRSWRGGRDDSAPPTKFRIEADHGRSVLADSESTDRDRQDDYVASEPLMVDARSRR
jgi:hypothetical protein